MNARTITPPNPNVPAAVPRPSGRKPSLARRLVLAELQHHARNALFSPHTTPPGRSPQELADATGLPIKQVRTTINNMHAVKQAINAGAHNKPLWRLTNAADMIKSAPVTPMTGTGYTCPELQRNPGIPDSRFAAFDLPSLVNGKRVDPKRPTAQLVGALADRTNNARC